MPDTGCLILDGAAGGAWNMALDEALWELAFRSGRPVLRFYQWSEPTVSLGYFQAHRERALYPALDDVALVRRPTGGGAIVHDAGQLTYCYLAPVNEHGRLERTERLYDVFHLSLLAALAKQNVACRMLVKAGSARQAREFLCFKRRSVGDVMLGNDKICGSAQRRRRQGVLQHGSVLLSRSSRLAEIPGIAELAGMVPSAERLLHDWIASAAAALGLRFVESLVPQEVIARSRELAARRYAADKWTCRR